MKKTTLIITLLFSTSKLLSQCITGETLHTNDKINRAIGCTCEYDYTLWTNLPPCNNSDYELFFEDNFDGNTLDLTKWHKPINGQGSLYHTSQNEYLSLDNAIVFDGILHITAKHETVLRRAHDYEDSTLIEPDGFPNLRYYEYTSASLWTYQTFYLGKYEARCKLPVGKGFWPAFWIYGDTAKRWNEIDFFENHDGVNYFSAGMGYDYKNQLGAMGCNHHEDKYDLSQWHIYTCIFEFDKTTWLIDGNISKIQYRFSDDNSFPITCKDKINNQYLYQLEAYPMEPMNILLTMAIGSDETGHAPNNSTPFPSSFDIDYVRFYSCQERLQTFLNQDRELLRVQASLVIVHLHHIFHVLQHTQNR